MASRFEGSTSSTADFGCCHSCLRSDGPLALNGSGNHLKSTRLLIISHLSSQFSNRFTFEIQRLIHGNRRASGIEYRCQYQISLFPSPQSFEQKLSGQFCLASISQTQFEGSGYRPLLTQLQGPPVPFDAEDDISQVRVSFLGLCCGGCGNPDHIQCLVMERTKSKYLLLHPPVVL